MRELCRVLYVRLQREESPQFLIAGQLFRVGSAHAGVRLYDHGIADFLNERFAAFPIVYQMEAGGLDPDMLPIEQTLEITKISRLHYGVSRSLSSRQGAFAPAPASFYIT